MSVEYWDTFKSIAREVLKSRMPHGWVLKDIEAYSDRVRAAFEWADDRAISIDCHAPNEHEALAEVAKVLDGYSRQQFPG
jgi:hypothetical protein